MKLSISFHSGLVMQENGRIVKDQLVELDMTG